MNQENLERMESYPQDDYIMILDDVLTPDQCRMIVERYIADPTRGYVPPNPNNPGEREYRDGEQLRISGKEEWKDVDHLVFETIGKGISAYFDRYKFCFAARDRGYTISHMKPGEKTSYHADNIGYMQCTRHLSAVIYLNEVKGGETVFPHQRRAVEPKAGRMALFPPFYTHRHYSNPAESERFIVVAFIEAEPPK